MGRRREAVRRIARLLRSESIELATPGYWTLTATRLPVDLRTALCTCPIEAAAMGFSSKEVKSSRQAEPRLLARTLLR